LVPFESAAEDSRAHVSAARALSESRQYIITRSP
jgi:hypothetical protein